MEFSNNSAKAYGFESHFGHISHRGEIGRHEGLKIPFWQQSTGSKSRRWHLYPGVAQLEERVLWEHEAAGS